MVVPLVRYHQVCSTSFYLTHNLTHAGARIDAIAASFFVDREEISSDLPSKLAHYQYETSRQLRSRTERP